MTATLHTTPPWLLGLLRRCTISEQRAVHRYRDTLRIAFGDVRNDRHSIDQLMTHWGRVLDTLEDGACGTPAFDRYVTRQRDRLAAAKQHRNVEVA